MFDDGLQFCVDLRCRGVGVGERTHECRSRGSRGGDQFVSPRLRTRWDVLKSPPYGTMPIRNRLNGAATSDNAMRKQVFAMLSVRSEVDNG
jgi:hypothetical protein